MSEIYLYSGPVYKTKMMKYLYCTTINNSPSKQKDQMWLEFPRQSISFLIPFTISSTLLNILAAHDQSLIVTVYR